MKLDTKAVFASYLIKLRLTPQILPDYLNIFLNSSFGIKQIRKFRRRAVNQANVNAEELKRIKIAVLPLDFQKKIQLFCDESWNGFEQSKTLYSQAENLLLEELGLKNFKPEEELSCVVNLSDIKSSHRMDAKYFQPKYKKIIENVKKHKLELLGDLVSMKKGFEPGSEEYQDDGKLFIRVSNISKLGFTDKEQKYISNELYQQLKGGFEPRAGDILLTKDATPGIAYVLKEAVEGIIASGIMRLKIKEDIDAEYLVLCINSLVCQMQAERDAGGSIIVHWKPEQIKNLLIPILSKPTQQKIADLVCKSHESRKKAKELLDEAKRKVEEAIKGEAKKRPRGERNGRNMERS